MCGLYRFFHVEVATKASQLYYEIASKHLIYSKVFDILSAKVATILL